MAPWDTIQVKRPSHQRSVPSNSNGFVDDEVVQIDYAVMNGRNEDDGTIEQVATSATEINEV